MRDDVGTVLWLESEVKLKSIFTNLIATGVVYQARDKETGEMVALKRCLPHHEARYVYSLSTYFFTHLLFLMESFIIICIL